MSSIHQKGYVRRWATEYSQYIKIILELLGGGMIIPSSHCPTVQYWRLSDFSTEETSAKYPTWICSFGLFGQSGSKWKFLQFCWIILFLRVFFGTLILCTFISHFFNSYVIMLSMLHDYCVKMLVHRNKNALLEKMSHRCASLFIGNRNLTQISMEKLD